MRKCLKDVPGGDVIKIRKLKHQDRTVTMAPWLVLLFFIVGGPLWAAGIPTQSAEIILQISGGQDNQLVFPSDVAVASGKIYIVDGGSHRVAVFNIKGEYLFQFGGRGAAKGQMNYPVGIDVAENKRVYVADSGNHRIQMFSLDGTFLSSFNVGSKDKPVRPVDVIRHSKTGNIMVTCSNHRLMVFSPKGKLLSSWGRNGMNQGEFRYPATITEMNDGRIAVVDVLNSRVQVFDPDGKPSMLVGEWGVLPGQLFRPKGVAIDGKGNIYISDSYTNVVQKFSDIGEFVSVLGKGGRPYKMNTPVGMTVYRNRLYVVEMRAHKVTVYKLAD